MSVENLKFEFRKTGTTTLGMICKDGALVASETKSTLGYLVASKESEKVLPIDDHILMTISGASGDAQALARYMKAEVKLYEVQSGRKISVKSAATLLSNILQSGRWSFFPYMVMLIIAGFDSKPQIFSLDPLGSIEEEKRFFATGSGSPIALGVLEDNYKDDITLKDAEKIAVRAIRSASERDIASGGVYLDLGIIKKDGFEIKRERLTK